MKAIKGGKVIYQPKPSPKLQAEIERLNAIREHRYA